MIHDAPLDAATAARAVLEAVDAGGEAAVVALLDEPTPGRRLVLVRDASGAERPRGTLGEGALDEAARDLARAGLDGSAEGGRHTLTTGGRAVAAYLEVHRAAPELFVVGAGHIAQPLVAMAAEVGFEVTVLDDRPAFATDERFPAARAVLRVDFGDPFAHVTVGPRAHVVLVTRGHRYDYECLLRLLRARRPPAYIGMIGSRRRVRATFEQLLREGVPRPALARVRAPVGLHLGARTPAEIALSVLAEIVMLRRGGDGRPLAEVADVLRRLVPEEP
ncbi:MAG: hypothetical protein D6701_07950 [Gemmatimonadetes bacterium]|nr:MAG: hypothetical protein D6701_07950 [Gemmatimonadota bacterium]